MLHVEYNYLHDWAICWVNVGKYSSTMEHMGEPKGLQLRIPMMCHPAFRAASVPEATGNFTMSSKGVVLSAK